MEAGTTTWMVGIGLAAAVLVGVAVASGSISISLPDTSEQDSIEQSASEQANPNEPPGEFGVVKRVIDPITVQLESGHVIRYVGVRPPAVTDEVHCFGKEALQANESVIGKRVRLEEEPLLSRSSDGAWTRYVYLQEGEGGSAPSPTPQMQPSPTAAPEQNERGEAFVPNLGNVTDKLSQAVPVPGGDNTSPTPQPAASPTPTSAASVQPSGSPAASPQAKAEDEEIFINERILEGGFGFPVVSKDMRHGEQLLSAARFASATGKGLWSACEVEGGGEEGGQLHTETLDECVIKGKVTSELEKIYRTPDCPAYGQTLPLKSNGGRWFCATDIAEDAGFERASDCPAPGEDEDTKSGESS